VETLAGAPFDRVVTELLAAPGSSPAWVAEHGDLVNVDDRQYRRWRAASRSRLVLGSYLRLPGPLGLPLSRWIERRLRTTNLAYRRSFPTDHAVRRAASHFESSGARFLVLGHFHQELRFPAGPGEVLVLPDWKRARRHAEWHPGPAGGAMRFVDSGE
jgi:UDP-2,3-diacylglucosamine pyrophosphatase LpxH